MVLIKTHLSLSLSHTHTVARNFSLAKEPPSPPKIPYFHDPFHKALQMKFTIIIIIRKKLIPISPPSRSLEYDFLLAHRKGATRFFTVNTEHYKLRHNNHSASYSTNTHLAQFDHVL